MSRAWLGLVLLAAGCAAHVPGDPFVLARPSEMHAVCLRLVDVDGRVYERPAWFNDEGYRHALRFPGARPGLCEVLAPREVKPDVKPEDAGGPCASRRCTQTKEN